MVSEFEQLEFDYSAQEEELTGMKKHIRRLLAMRLKCDVEKIGSLSIYTCLLIGKELEKGDKHD